jgi:hypothetical protein
MEVIIGSFSAYVIAIFFLSIAVVGHFAIYILFNRKEIFRHEEIELPLDRREICYTCAHWYRSQLRYDHERMCVLHPCPIQLELTAALDVCDTWDYYEG